MALKRINLYLHFSSLKSTPALADPELSGEHGRFFPSSFTRVFIASFLSSSYCAQWVLKADHLLIVCQKNTWLVFVLSIRLFLVCLKPSLGSSNSCLLCLVHGFTRLKIWDIQDISSLCMYVPATPALSKWRPWPFPMVKNLYRKKVEH